MSENERELEMEYEKRFLEMEFKIHEMWNKNFSFDLFEKNLAEARKTSRSVQNDLNYLKRMYADSATSQKHMQREINNLKNCIEDEPTWDQKMKSGLQKSFVTGFSLVLAAAIFVMFINNFC